MVKRTFKTECSECGTIFFYECNRTRLPLNFWVKCPNCGEEWVRNVEWDFEVK